MHHQSHLSARKSPCADGHGSKEYRATYVERPAWQGDDHDGQHGLQHGPVAVDSQPSCTRLTPSRVENPPIAPEVPRQRAHQTVRRGGHRHQGRLSKVSSRLSPLHRGMISLPLLPQTHRGEAPGADDSHHPARRRHLRVAAAAGSGGDGLPSPYPARQQVIPEEDSEDLFSYFHGHRRHLPCRARITAWHSNRNT